MSDFDKISEQEENLPLDPPQNEPSEPVSTELPLESPLADAPQKPHKKGPRAAGIVCFVLAVVSFFAFAIISTGFYMTLFKISTTESAGEAVFNALFAIPIFLVLMFFSGAPSLIFSIVSTVLLGKAKKYEEKRPVLIKVLFGISVALLVLTVAIALFTILYFALNNN